MRSVLNVKLPAELALLYSRKEAEKHRIDNPEPQSSKKHTKCSSSKNLCNSMVSQIDPRVHRQESKRPSQEIQYPLAFSTPKSNPFIRQKSEVDSEEKHILRVTRGPTMRITHFQQRTRLRTGLLNRGLDELIYELRDYKPSAKNIPCNSRRKMK